MILENGDSVICIDNIYIDNIFPLTIGKIYTIVHCESGSSGVYVKVFNDLGLRCLYKGDRFVRLSDYRIEVIDEILE